MDKRLLDILCDPVTKTPVKLLSRTQLDALNREIARETGQPYERVEQDTERNFWMGAEEAKAYGLVSRIVQSASEV